MPPTPTPERLDENIPVMLLGNSLSAGQASCARARMAPEAQVSPTTVQSVDVTFPGLPPVYRIISEWHRVRGVVSKPSSRENHENLSAAKRCGSLWGISQAYTESSLKMRRRFRHRLFVLGSTTNSAKLAISAISSPATEIRLAAPPFRQRRRPRHHSPARQP